MLSEMTLSLSLYQCDFDYESQLPHQLMPMHFLQRSDFPSHNWWYQHAHPCGNYLVATEHTTLKEENLSLSLQPYGQRDHGHQKHHTILCLPLNQNSAGEKRDEMNLFQIKEFYQMIDVNNNEITWSREKTVNYEAEMNMHIYIPAVGQLG